MLSAIAVITLIAVVAGATYAYLQAQGGGSSDIDASVITSTTDKLSTIALVFYQFFKFDQARQYLLWTNDLLCASIINQGRATNRNSLICLGY